MLLKSTTPASVFSISAVSILGYVCVISARFRVLCFMSVQGRSGELQCGLMLKSATPASVFSISHVFFGAGVFRVQRACSGSSLGLWGCTETLSTESAFFLHSAMRSM